MDKRTIIINYLAGLAQDDLLLVLGDIGTRILTDAKNTEIARETAISDQALARVAAIQNMDGD